MGLAVVSLIVLAILGLLGGLVLFRVFGQAAARNEDRPGGGGDEDGGQQANLGEEGKRSIRLLFGRLASILGMLIAAAGAIFSVNTATSITVAGILLGVIGFALGARRFGIAAIVVTVALLLISLAAINGLIPGFDPPGYEKQGNLAPLRESG